MVGDFREVVDLEKKVNTIDLDGLTVLEMIGLDIFHDSLVIVPENNNKQYLLNHRNVNDALNSVNEFLLSNLK